MDDTSDDSDEIKIRERGRKEVSESHDQRRH